MDDFVFGLLCGGSVLFLPGVVLAVIALASARSARDAVQRLEGRLADVEAAQLHRGLPAAANAAPATSLAAPAAVASKETRVPEAAESAPTAAAPAKPEPAAPAAAAATAAADGAPAPAPPANPTPAMAPPPGPPPISAPRPPAPPPRPPVDLGKLIERGAVWVFAGAAGLLLVIAVLFGLREAVRFGFFGPVARFGTAVAVGVASWLIAELLRWRKYPTPAAALSGAGVAILYAALYAGHSRWGLISQPVTFASMVGITVVSMVMAERRNSRFVAWLAVLGGFLTPLLLSTGENRAVAFFSYMLLLDAGVLYAARRRTWPDLVVGSGALTLALYLGWVAAYRAPDQVVIGLVAAACFATAWLVTGRRTLAQDGVLANVTGSGAMLIGLGFWLMGLLAMGTPTDPLRADPVSFLPLPWDLGSTAMYGGGYLVVGALALPLMARANVATRWMAAAAIGIGAFGYGLAWTMGGGARWDVVAVVLPLTAIAAALVGGTPGAIVPLAGVGVATFIGAAAAPVPSAWLPVAVVGLAIAALVAARHTARWSLPLGAVFAAPALLPGLDDRLVAGEAAALVMATLPAYASFAAVPFLRPRRNDLATAVSAALAPFAFFWPGFALWQHYVGKDFDGAFALVIASVALFGGLVLRRAGGVRLADKELAILVAVSLFGLSAAIPMQLRDAWLTVAWSVLMVALAVVNRRLKSPLFPAFAVALAAAVGARLLLNPYALEYGRGEGMILFNWTLYTWGVPTVCLLLAAHFFEHPWLKAGLRTLSVFTAFALVNLQIAHAFSVNNELSFRSERLAEEMVRSLAWGGFGLGLIVLGIRSKSRSTRLLGLGFAALGAGKVFLVDMWSLSGFARVGAFGGMAVTLLLAAVAFAWLARSDTPQSSPPSEP